jgi:PDZ domain/Aspartyl protease
MRMTMTRMLILIVLNTLAVAAGAATLDCWQKTSGGGARAIQREATFSTGGLEGTFHTWSRADGAYRIETAIPAAGYRSVQAYDGRRAWKADGATRAHELAALELAAIVTDAFFESRQAPKAAVAAGEPNTFVVDPPGGTAVTVTLDPKTCLPRTYARKTAAGTATITIEEWMTVEGITLPATLRQSNGDPKFDVTIRYTSTKLDASMADALFALPKTAVAVKIPNGAPYVELPFELTQNHIYLQGQLGGKPTSFVLDTGAEASVIDAQHAAAIGLAGAGSIAARGNGESTVSAQVIAKPELLVAGMKMPVETMYAVPLRALWPREGRAMEAILGHDVLSHFVVEIDYAASKIRLHDPERFTVPAGAASLPMSYETNVPAIRAAFELPNGRRIEGRMIVDTGNSGGLDLYGPFVDKNDIRATLGRIVEGAGGMGVGGIAKQDLSRITALHLGPFVLRAPVVSLSRDAKGGAAHPELAGNLGGRVLRRFTVFVDYPHDRLVLKPNNSIDTPFEYDMSGLALAAEGEAFDRIVVRRVLPGTPALAAGFKEGDEIASIDGRKADVHRLRALFLEPQKTYELRVLRGAEVLNLKLTTRRAI